MTDTFAIGADIKLKHGLLFEWLIQNGMSQADLARKLDISLARIGEIVNMKRVPKEPIRLQLSIITGISEEDLFPEEYKLMIMANSGVKWQRLYARREIPRKALPDVASYAVPKALPKAADLTKKREREQIIEECLTTLPPRLQEVLRMKFGFNDTKEERTLDQIANKFSLTRERIRQIEKQALETLEDQLKKRGINGLGDID